MIDLSYIKMFRGASKAQRLGLVTKSHPNIGLMSVVDIPIDLREVIISGFIGFIANILDVSKQLDIGRSLPMSVYINC